MLWEQLSSTRKGQTFSNAYKEDISTGHFPFDENIFNKKAQSRLEVTPGYSRTSHLKELTQRASSFRLIQSNRAKCISWNTFSEVKLILQIRRSR